MATLGEAPLTGRSQWGNHGAILLSGRGGRVASWGGLLKLLGMGQLLVQLGGVGRYCHKGFLWLATLLPVLQLYLELCCLCLLVVPIWELLHCLVWDLWAALRKCGNSLSSPPHILRSPSSCRLLPTCQSNWCWLMCDVQGLLVMRKRTRQY